MRNPINVLKSLEEHAKDKAYKYKRLYRNLYNPEFYLLAYKNIASSPGSMTAGTDGKTLDGLSMVRINRIITSLKDHSYQPNPARRTYIAKQNSKKKRPLGIPSTDDKLVQEVIRMILEAIYEPTFSRSSHGFRPNRSCHTALLSVKTTFTGVKWIIEGDIQACFDCFDHHVTINLLRRRIHDEYFISLMWKLLKAGYMEQWKVNKTFSGTPQGSGVSPILSNIYLSELDVFMTEYKERFDKGNAKFRPLNKEYSRAHSRYMFQSSKLKRQKSFLSPERQDEIKKELRQLQLKKLNVSYYPAIEPNFKRIQYNRYCDDFVIGVIGSKEDAQQIKADVKKFLSEKLKLTLSEEKTKITHSGEFIRYLGYDFTVCRDKSFTRNKKGHLYRPYYGNVRLYLPREKWIGKLKEYKAIKIKKDKQGKEHWKATHRGFLINKTDVEIISKYNSEIRGLYHYYRLASNVSVLGVFRWWMEYSMLKTFAGKYNSNVNKVKKGRMRNGIFGVDYTTKSGTKRCEFYSERLIKIEKPAPDFSDTLPQYRRYDAINSLAARLRKGVCEMCDTDTGSIKMHHVKSLKALTGNTLSEMLMIEKRRKTLALCDVCFEQVSNGLL